MKYKNSTKAFALWTDWNRPGAKGIYGGIGWYRIINPLGKLENTTIEGQYTFGSDKRVEIAKEIGEKGQVMVVKYVDSFQAANHLLTIRDFLGIKLLVDIDDNVLEVHPHNYAYKDTAPGTEAYKVFKYLFREADGLICSTQPLKEYFLKYNQNIWVIPNAIDEDIWNVKREKVIKEAKNDGTPVGMYETVEITDGKTVELIKRIAEKNKKVKIGWVNGPTHEQDVPALLPALKEILKKYPQVEFTHIGWKSPEFDRLKGKQKMVFGTNGYKDFPKFLAGLGMDILVAPLIDDEFNRGKSNIKWMEGAMCEIPMVCSDVYPYHKSITNGKDGYLAKTTADWIKYLSILIENPEKRLEIGKEAKKTVLEQYPVEKVLPKYVEIFQELTKPQESEITAVITRRKGESDEIALQSLLKQTYRGLEIVRIEDTEGKGANWARNEGFRRVKTPYVLFSDNDIAWKLDAVKSLYRTLKESPEASYAYGAYSWEFPGKTELKLACKEQWSEERLKDFAKGNIVSTMTLVRSQDFPGFDEKLRKFQDWDVWLTMLEQGKSGKHCGKVIFHTQFSPKGISADKSLDYLEHLKILMAKHPTLC